MKLIPINIKDATRHLLREKPVRDKFDIFKTNLLELLRRIEDLEKLPKNESEEHMKNDIRDFLLNTYYKGSNLVNTNFKKDLVVYLENTVNSDAGVVIEAKRPKSPEMISLDNANKKAFHEVILYYMDDRMKEKSNTQLKNLIITNINEWYIIDANEFDNHIYKDFKKLYELTKNDKKDNDFFYEEARKKLESFTYEMPCVKFNLLEYRDKLKSKSKSSEVELVALYKIFSPNFLLKKRVTNDSNSLDTPFYTELLHIIGLTETDDSGKKVIQRKKESARNSGSIIEDTILQLDSLDKINRLEKPDLFGSTYTERLFNVALELCITWINRILFLKLLESQLISYQHQGQDSEPFQFLNFRKIKSYDDLNSLFFQVLAKKHEDRNNEIKKAFEKVPYLNSSLFEPTEIEHTTLFISNLQGDKEIPVSTSTKLLNESGKKQTGSLDTLNYLFRFLEAYDFSTDSGEEIQEVNRTLMNASVLGLIFEKINGYKDGAVFTPSFVTMYMCRETIRRTVVQKFNEVKKWNCKDFEDLQEKILYTDKEVRKEANKIVNSIKMCDPSVGSGHYLVSGLNEILSIKNDLKIMQYRNSTERIIDHSFIVLDDELIVTNLETGNRFKYNPINPNSQRIQETLFHEKQTIIENCLFGVDINPNSVKICRLRLWIELLKNAYYKTPTELETLPNIDINIKCGNSLISRFPIDADLSQALKKSKNYTIDSYRVAVDTYRNATSKEEKREMERLINIIKSNFKSEISKNDPKVKKLYKLSGDLDFLTNQTSLFEKTKKEKAEWNKKLKVLTDEIDKLEKEIEEIKGNKIYENAFEWRFEFPEVLNDKGDFVGFDIVVGNPPYVISRETFSESQRQHYIDKFKLIHEKPNLYLLFIEKSFQILKINGEFSFIVPNSITGMESAYKVREFLINNFRINSIINLLGETFQGVNVESCILSISKKNAIEDVQFMSINSGIIDNSLFELAKINTWKNNRNFLFDILSSKEDSKILSILKENSQLLYTQYEVKVGLQAYEKGKGKPNQTEEDVRKHIFDYRYKFDDNTYPYLNGSDIGRYNLKWSGQWLRYGEWLSQPKTMIQFQDERILIREISGTYPYIIQAMLVNETYLNNKSILNVLSKNGEYSLRFLLGFLNSKLISFYHKRQTVKGNRNLFPKIVIKDLQNYPIPILERKEQQPLIDKVDKILLAKKQGEDTILIENEIDQMVYKLYELTEEEIRIIEGK